MSATSGLTPSKANTIINQLTGYDSSSSVYLGLSTSAPVVSGTTITYTEPSGNGYARVKLDSSVMNAATNGAATNKATIKFDEVRDSSWGQITHLILFSSATGDNPIGVAQLTAPITPSVGSMPIFRVGNFGASITMYGS